jgi:hypothetical protein
MTNLSQAAREGWQMVSGNTHLWSSDTWLAFEAGAQARRMGLGDCVRARKGRGYSVRFKPAGGAGVRLIFDTDTLKFARSEVDHGA